MAFSAGGGLSAQETLKTLNLSAPFSNIPGTPRVVRNEFKQFWLVTWRQGNPGKIIGRIVRSDGSAAGQKVLATGVTPAGQSFDISYNTVTYSYLLAFENAKGLQVQFFNQELMRQGTANLIEAGVSDTNPRLAFDPAGNQFVIHWLGSQDGTARRVLKNKTLDKDGKPLAENRILATAVSDKVFGSLNVSANQKNGNLIAMVTEQNGSSGSLLGYLLRPNGSLLRATPIKFQPPTAGLNASAGASFDDSGAGFGLWADRMAIKYRKISASGSFSSGTRTIANVADMNSQQTSILFDSRNRQFVGIWAHANKIDAIAFNQTTGALVKQPFQVASFLLTNSRNVTASYDPRLGNILAVWEDSTAPASQVSGANINFRVRAALFFVSSAPSQVNVTVGDNFFSPKELTVTAGTMVKWTWNGNNAHTVTSGSPGSNPGALFDSPTQNRGATFEFRFTEAGTFPYFCRIHGAAMSGTVIVTSDGGEPPRY